MTIIFKGNQAFPHLIENFVCGCDNVRLMKYCYVLSSIEEGDIIYNHLTGTTVLISKNTVREFLRTEYAQKNYFSVPVDFDEDSCFNDQLTSKLSKELREKEKIEGSIKALYGAFLRERQKNNQRRNHQLKLYPHPQLLFLFCFYMDKVDNLQHFHCNLLYYHFHEQKQIQLIHQLNNMQLFHMIMLLW